MSIIPETLFDTPSRDWGHERIKAGSLVGVVIHLRLHRKIGKWEAFIRRDAGSRLGALLATGMHSDPLIAINAAVFDALKIARQTFGPATRSGAP